MKALTVLIIVLLWYTSLPAQGQENTPEGQYTAGFTSLKLVDSSRRYKPNTTTRDSLHYRPVDLDIWYPSQASGQTKLIFKDLFLLLEQRANQYEDGKNYKGFVDELAQFYALELGLTAADGKKLLEFTTNSYSDVTPSVNKFPVIFYMAGLNGMGFENFRILERLASHGFIVVSIWSVGRYPGFMTNQKEDMMEQVWDAEFAMKYLRSQRQLNVDFDHAGVLACSWGGMSAAVLIDRNPNLNTMVSLDGTETHYFGESDKDDADIRDIHTSQLLHPETGSGLRYLYLESGNKLADYDPTKEYHYFKKLNSANKYYLRFLNSKHEDFTSLPSTLQASPVAIEVHGQISDATVMFFEQYLSNNMEGFKPYYDKLSLSKEISTQPYEKDLATTNKVSMEGRVVDKKTGLPLAFVNIGILNKDRGTVSDETGKYALRIGAGMEEDTVQISMIGYETKQFKVGELLSRRADTILLAEAVTPLNEVVVTTKAMKQRNVGNKTTSKFLSTGFNYQQLGAEMGVKVNVKDDPTFVDAFHFNISYNRLSAKAFFRLNIYSVKNGKPSKNILTGNIIIPVDAKQTGLISIDLKPYNIVLHEDAIVTMEWVKSEGANNRGEAIFFSAGVFNAGTLVKLSSQGKFKKYGGLGVGMNLDVRY